MTFNTLKEAIPQNKYFYSTAFYYKYLFSFTFIYCMWTKEGEGRFNFVYATLRTILSITG